MKDDAEKKYIINDLSELQHLYEKFLIDYRIYLTLMGFDNLFETFCVFDYMLKNGYLSYNHKYKYEFDESKLKDHSKSLSYGICTLTGKGVCRNAASLLYDLNNLNSFFDNSIVYVYSHNAVHLIKDSNNSQSLEEQYKIINQLYNPYKRIKLKKLIRTGDYEVFKEVDNAENKTINKIVGNHMINYIKVDDINLFVDPTNHVIYKFVNGSKTKIYSDNIDCDIKRFDNPKVAKDYYSGNNYKLDELIKIYKSSKKDLNRYADSFENFYQEERELLDYYNKLFESIDYQKVRKYKL